MFGLNLWATPFLHATPPRPPGLEDKELPPSPLPPPGLMMLASTAEAARGSAHYRALSSQHLLKDSSDHIAASAMRFYPSEHHNQGIPHPLFSPFHPHFLKAGLDGRSIGFPYPAHAPPPRGMTLFGQDDRHVDRRSAFSPTKRRRQEGVSPDAVSDKGVLDCTLPKATTPGIAKASPPAPRESVSSPRSSPGASSDTESRLSRKEADIVSTVEYHHGRSGCPVCGVDLQPGTHEDHLLAELRQLDACARDTVSQTESSPQRQSPGGTDMVSPYTGFRKDKQASVSRYQTYLRVRGNRQSRLQVKTSRHGKRYLAAVHAALEAHEPSSRPDMTSPIKCELKHEASPHKEEVTDVNRTRHIVSTTQEEQMIITETSEPDLNVDTDDSHLYGTAQYSDGDLITNQSEADVRECRRNLQETAADNNRPSRLLSTIPANLRPQLDQKCTVCKREYDRPVTSTQCWHVHCEHCWLSALGSKRVCPQCHVITSPADLRRLFL